MKLIDLHKEWCESGRMSDDGLCEILKGRNKNLLNRFEPTDEDVRWLNKKGFSTAYWASGVSCNNWKVKYGGYTPLRQTIVLLICAMNNEL